MTDTDTPIEPYGRDKNGQTGEYHFDAVDVRHRYGYQIDGESPVYVGTCERWDTAIADAKREAQAIARKLREVGTSVGVSFWTQSRTTTTERAFGVPQTQALKS